MPKKTGKTIAEIVEATGFSDRTVRVALKDVEPAGYTTGYNNRKVATYSREQVAAAGLKKAKK